MKIKLTALFFIITVSLFAQKYGNVWQFGNRTGIDFNSCTAIPLQTAGNPGPEGCSSVCDAVGQLLFYTNSDSVWDKLNHSMPNGYLIPSSGTISQVIIIPKPLSTTLYYVITTTIQGSTPYLQYHEVDMSLNGGLGDVSSKNNVLSTTRITEQVAATYQSNGVDIWLMVHEYLTNKFMVYSVTASGIAPTPVVSNVGPAHKACISGMNARGEIKFSPDGQRVAFTANGIGNNDSTNILCVFHFDNATGMVSNPIGLRAGRGDYGLSFSADNSKLYEATWKAFNFTAADKNYIYQFDLAGSDSATISASRATVDSSASTSTVYGDLKLAPDGKIYVAIHNSHYLGVINAPNLPAPLCNYVANGFSLGSSTAAFGLNNYIEYTTYCNTTAVADADVSSTKLSVFPNPFSKTATLKFNYAANENYTLSIYDPHGKMVRSIKNIHPGEVEIEKQDLSAGLYFFVLRDQKQIIGTGKLAVE